MSKGDLPRTLSGRDAFMLIVGNIIGIGIFTTTGYISQYAQSPGGMIFLWFMGGLLAFCGGLTYAELSSRFPHAGGDFHYLSHAYHPMLGYLFGWAAYVVTYTGSIAVIAVGFAHYFLNLFPEVIRAFQFSIPLISLDITSVKIVSVIITFLFTQLNIRGIRSGARWQTVLTIFGIVTLLAFIILGFSSKAADWENLTPFLNEGLNLQTFSLMGVALIGIYFTYSGWTVIVYVAGEVREPQKSIPGAMVAGILTVTFLYILINIVYFLAMPIEQMEDVVDIGFRTFAALRGESWSIFFTAMIMIAVLSTLNSTVLSGARIYYAMGKQGRFFRQAGELHSKYQSPGNSLWLQFGWTVLLILSGTFNQLLTYTVFIMICFAFLAGISVFLLRRKHQTNREIYHAWGYPVTPILFSAISGWIMLNTLWNHPWESLLGILVVVIGIPFYFYFERKSEKKNDFIGKNRK